MAKKRQQKKSGSGLTASQLQELSNSTKVYSEDTTKLNLNDDSSNNSDTVSISSKYSFASSASSSYQVQPFITGTRVRDRSAEVFVQKLEPSP